MNILIRNARIVDGTGTSGYEGDVEIQDGLISKIGTIEPDGQEIIDANGCVLCPGFIDTHSHSDLKIMEEPFQAPKILQGITTEVLGQDGISMAPLPARYIESWKKNLAGLDGQSDTIDWHYGDTNGYLSTLEKNGVCCNEAYLVPHGNVRLEVMGISDADPDEMQLEEMCSIVRREMEAGAFGLSTGLIYIPCAYSRTEELIALCKVVAEYDGVFVVHQRSEADGILPSMEEVLTIGRESGVRVHFSHFKACGKKSWDLIPGMLEKLDRAKAEGLKVSYDQYPYVAGSTTLSVILPPWVHVGGADEMLKRLSDDKTRVEIETYIRESEDSWDNFIDFAGYEGIFITYVGSEKNQQYIGKSLAQIADLRKVTPFQAACDLLLEENNSVSMVDFYGTEEHVKLFLNREEQNVCTDGLLSGKPHPRVYGAFPRVLSKYVREEKCLTLESAIHKMTGKAAESLGIKNRGRIAQGYCADLVIFDPETIRDKGTYEDPCQHPEGIKMVMVNGTVLFDGVNSRKIRAGKVLRKTKGDSI